MRRTFAGINGAGQDEGVPQRRGLVEAETDM